MASLATSIFDLVEGDPAESQENLLTSLAGYETGTGEGLTTAAAKFDEAILSGDPTRIASALAPEISSGAKQVEQQKLQGAEFGSRSGGTAASTAAAEAGERGNIINLEGGLQKSTADSAGSLGSGLLSQSSGNTNDVAGLKTARRKAVDSDVSGITTGAAEIAGDLFGGRGVPSDGSGTTASPDGGGTSAFTPNTSSETDPFTPSFETEQQYQPDIITPYY